MHLRYVNVSTKFAGSRTSNSYNLVTLDSLMISGSNLGDLSVALSDCYQVRAAK